MEQLRRYDFEEAQPFLDFLSQNREKIVGQKICRFYTDCNWRQSFSPIVFELEQFCVVVDYQRRSSIRLYIADNRQIQEDQSLNFLYTDIPGCGNLKQQVWEQEDFPYLGCTIEEIEVKRSASAVETNPSTGAARPAGGDYFSAIAVRLDGGARFFICAMPSFCDGGMDIWD